MNRKNIKFKKILNTKISRRKYNSIYPIYSLFVRHFQNFENQFFFQMI